MGYSAEIGDVDFVIPFENLTEAHRAMCAINEPNKVANAEKKLKGGWFSPAHFAWMDEDYDEKLTNAKEILDELGFATKYDFDGLRILSYEAEKIGDEDEFLEAIAKLVKEDSYIEWIGEDGERWLLEFNGEEMRRKNAKISYE